MEKRYFITPEDYEKARLNGIEKQRLYQRVYQCGWDIEKAIREPLMTGNERRCHPKKYQDIAAANGIDYPTYKSRLSRGWGYFRASTQPMKPRNKKLAKDGSL
ncbi:hypothetical protein BK128_08380 [Viridibacillus sp. FSL H7-0596]|nr:hypothetical protein BK128_08380 [Viridibacillus sp. FSL H7-0596]